MFRDLATVSAQKRTYLRLYDKFAYFYNTQAAVSVHQDGFVIRVTDTRSPRQHFIDM
jgi:hypothetical protein